MAKVCLFCGEYIILGFSSCVHNWAWREVDDETADDFCDSLKKRNKLLLKSNMKIEFGSAVLDFDQTKKQNINGVSVYEYEENDLTVYVSGDKKRVIAFSNTNLFRVDNSDTCVIDLLYETDEKKSIVLIEDEESDNENDHLNERLSETNVEQNEEKKPTEKIVNAKQSSEKETVIKKSVKKETDDETNKKENEPIEKRKSAKNDVKNSTRGRKLSKREQASFGDNDDSSIQKDITNSKEKEVSVKNEEKEPQTFEYKGHQIGKVNLVSKIYELKDMIYKSVQTTQEFLQLLQDNEKLFLPIADAKVMSKFRAIMQELYLCPSLGVFMYALHGDEANKVGIKYTLYPVYDEYYGIIAFSEKGLKEIRDAYRFRKYWSTRAEADCYELIIAPAVKTVFTDYYLPRVLSATAITAKDRKILNNPIGGKTPKQNLLEYIGC